MSGDRLAADVDWNAPSVSARPERKQARRQVRPAGLWKPRVIVRVLGGTKRSEVKAGMTIALTLIFALNLYQRSKRWES